MAKKTTKLSLIDLLVPAEIWDGVRKPIISAFLVFNLTLILFYFAKPTPVTNKVVDLFRNYFWFVGLAQDYGVFAPSPRQNNLHVIALVTYDDGSTRIYTFPRIDRLSLTQKLQKERYRKFIEDNAAMEWFSFLHKDIAIYVARQCDVFPDNHPRLVSLIRFMSNVPQFQEKVTAGDAGGKSELKQARYSILNVPHTEMTVLATVDVSEQFGRGNAGQSPGNYAAQPGNARSKGAIPFKSPDQAGPAGGTKALEQETGSVVGKGGPP